MTPDPATAPAYHPWTTFLFAREEARRRGDRRVGTDHLVLGLLHHPEVVAALGVTLDAARQAFDGLDRRALASVGVAPDLDAPPLPVRDLPGRPTVRSILKDRLPTTPAAKHALQEAGKPLRRGHHIEALDILAEVLECAPPDPAATLLGALGVDIPAVRGRLPGSPAVA